MLTQFGDDWTPSHLQGGPANLYKEIALALKGAEWRKPGLVAVAFKVAAGGDEHSPIDFAVPASYMRATGANGWRSRTDGGMAGASNAWPSSLSFSFAPSTSAPGEADGGGGPSPPAPAAMQASGGLQGLFAAAFAPSPGPAAKLEKVQPDLTA